MIMILCVSFFKFGNGDGPKLCRLKKVDVSSKFFENLFRSGLTVVSSNDIVTTKIDIKNVKNHRKINKQYSFLKDTKLQFTINKNYFFLFILLSSIIKSLMY